MSHNDRRHKEVAHHDTSAQNELFNLSELHQIIYSLRRRELKLCFSFTMAADDSEESNKSLFIHLPINIDAMPITGCNGGSRSSSSGGSHPSPAKFLSHVSMSWGHLINVDWIYHRMGEKERRMSSEKKEEQLQSCFFIPATQARWRISRNFQHRLVHPLE